MKPSKKYYAKSVYLTIAVYVGILFILFVSIRSARLLVPNTDPNAKIVQAVSINQQQVSDEINKIKSLEASKKRAELEKQKELTRQATQAKQQRILEEKRLTTLKEQQKQLETAKQIAEQKANAALAEMQKKQALMKKQLMEIKKQQSAARPAKTSPQLSADKPASTTEKKTESVEKSNSALEKSLQSQIDAEEQQMGSVRNAAMLSEMDKYKALVLNAIGQQWIMPSNVNKNLSMQLLIRLAPGGMVLDVKVLQSSGDAILDRSVLTAVSKASPLPVPTDLQLFDQFRELHLTVRPEGLIDSNAG